MLRGVKLIVVSLQTILRYFLTSVKDRKIMALPIALPIVLPIALPIVLPIALPIVLTYLAWGGTGVVGGGERGNFMYSYHNFSLVN